MSEVSNVVSKPVSNVVSKLVSNWFPDFGAGKGKGCILSVYRLSAIEPCKPAASENGNPPALSCGRA